LLFSTFQLLPVEPFYLYLEKPATKTSLQKSGS
jgi:hypothetical protein